MGKVAVLVSESEAETEVAFRVGAFNLDRGCHLLVSGRINIGVQ